MGKEVDESDEGMPIGSRVTRFVVRVIDAILPSLQECPDSVDRTQHPCQLETIGKQTTTKGKNIGRSYAIMNACAVCSKAGVKNGTGGGISGTADPGAGAMRAGFCMDFLKTWTQPLTRHFQKSEG